MLQKALSEMYLMIKVSYEKAYQVAQWSTGYQIKETGRAQYVEGLINDGRWNYNANKGFKAGYIVGAYKKCETVWPNGVKK